MTIATKGAWLKNGPNPPNPRTSSPRKTDTDTNVSSIILFNGIFDYLP